MQTTTTLPLYTIGYEGFTVDVMLSLLKQEQIQCIIDVRQLPLSRKKGFSKNRLAANAANYDIKYVHMVALGCPKPIRYTYKENGDWNQYTERFLEYLGGQSLALHTLLHHARKERCVLLCYEADVNTCHRLYVSNVISNMDERITPVHLTKIDRQIPIAVAGD